ncbi:MAG: PAS domain S-box protein [Thioclava marina]|uniref:PAS domain-containing protein n=1 Tax=Rhodobacterales TaxID=204455 RepID=UPI001987EB15|nr:MULTISPECIES: PAS domain S-box protein [Rhodobacterales]MBC7145331.1 PAS domain S-box protein [Thioclava marina]MBN8190000.1 PAS domain S-box protein [Salipiger thiooxidans]
MDREQIARKLFEGMPDALVVADRKGIIRVWNGGAERIFGFAEGEALGQSLDIITPERLRERHWIGYEATMRTGQTKYGEGDLLSVPAIRKDGAQISIQFSIVPLRGEDGDLQAVAAIMRDVTEDFEERKRLRRALRG